MDLSVNPALNYEAKLSGRIFSAATPWELEYRYLLNETFLGEKAAITLLEDLWPEITELELYSYDIRKQIDEEHEHYDSYSKLLGLKTPHPGSKFDLAIVQYVKSLPTLTEKTFCIQTIFEGFSLGAISWRIRGRSSPAESQIDRRIYAEEFGHTTLSHKYLCDLIRKEGIVPIESQMKHLRKIIAIFGKSYSVESVVEAVNSQIGGRSLSSTQLQRSVGYNQFKWHNSKILRKCLLRYQLSYYKSASLVKQ